MLCSYGNNEWRDDLKRLLKRTGLEGKRTVFLLADTQIVQESFLEVRSCPVASSTETLLKPCMVQAMEQAGSVPRMQDINNILNSGDVPNLMRTEDLEEIGGVLRPMMQAQVRLQDFLAILRRARHLSSFLLLAFACLSRQSAVLLSMAAGWTAQQLCGVCCPWIRILLPDPTVSLRPFKDWRCTSSLQYLPALQYLGAL